MQALQRNVAKGFTLIELLVVVTIGSILVVGTGVVGFLCYAAGKAAGIF